MTAKRSAVMNVFMAGVKSGILFRSSNNLGKKAVEDSGLGKTGEERKERPLSRPPPRSPPLPPPSFLLTPPPSRCVVTVLVRSKRSICSPSAYAYNKL